MNWLRVGGASGDGAGAGTAREPGSERGRWGASGGPGRPGAVHGPGPAAAAHHRGHLPHPGHGRLLRGERFLEELLAVQPRLSSLVFLSPAEALVSQFKLALGLAAIGTYPVFLWQIWQLVRDRARGGSRMIYWVVPLASLLFAGGAAFAFFLVLPTTLAFFLSFASPELEAMISTSSFVNFVLYLTLPFGFLFQFPVIVYFMARVGLLSPGFLAHNRRYAILLVFILAAFLTPGTDPFSQLLLAIPMVVLYEVGHLVARLAWRRRRRAEVAQG